MEGKNRGPSPRPLGVYGQILLGFGAFTLVIAALLWVFQIFLLGPFYQLIKTDQVENTAEAVLRQLDEPQDTLRQTVEDLCYDTDINILVIDENGRLLADSYASQKQSPLRIALAQGGLPAQTILAQLYNEVNLQGGRLEEKFPLGQGDSTPQVVLYGRIQRTAGGEALMVLLETEITPVDSTVETLKIQLLCLTLVMAVLGLGLALFIARRIARPLAAINQSAKKLGEGDYAIRFEGDGHPGGRRAGPDPQLRRRRAFQGGRAPPGTPGQRLPRPAHSPHHDRGLRRGHAGPARGEHPRKRPDHHRRDQRLTNLVNDLLDLSKLEAGVVPLDKTRFNLTDSIRQTLKRYDKLADYRFPFYADRDVFVTADELRISQVVYNLVNNAITYAGADKTITLRQTVGDGMVRVSVTDTGEGIPADKLRDIWQRYYKVGHLGQRYYSQRG